MENTNHHFLRAAIIIVIVVPNFLLLFIPTFLVWLVSWCCCLFTTVGKIVNDALSSFCFCGLHCCVRGSGILTCMHEVRRGMIGVTCSLSCTVFRASARRDAGLVTDDRENNRSSLVIAFLTLTLSTPKYTFHPVNTFPKSLVSYEERNNECHQGNP